MASSWCGASGLWGGAWPGCSSRGDKGTPGSVMEDLRGAGTSLGCGTGQDILFFWLLLVWSCNLELVPTSKALQLLADSTPGWGLGSYRGCLK